MTESVGGCVLVTGMPGAGKTTVTSLAARLMPRAAQVAGDDVNAMIRSGFVWFMGDPTEQALRHDEPCNRNMCSLANNFIDFGFTVLMDTVLADRSELDFFLALLSPRPVRLLVLDPGIESCKTRNAGRAPQEQFEFDGYERLEADMKREFRDIGWWLDPKTLDFHMRCPKTMADRHIQSDHRTGGRCLALRGQVAHSHVAARLDLRPVDVLLPLATNLDVVQVHCAPFAGRPLMTGQVDVSVG